MNNWKRITITIFVLIGSTASFGYWSLNEFESAFEGLNPSYSSNVSSVIFSLEASKDNTPATSSEIFTELIDPDDYIIATSSEISKKLATSTDIVLSLLFPQKGDQVYAGCAYKVYWQSSSTVTFLHAALIDAGTRKVMGPIASGIPKENTIKKENQSLEWGVGMVWPGEYYIELSKINNINVKIKSRVFEISNMPDGISKQEKEDICIKSVASTTSI